MALPVDDTTLKNMRGFTVLLYQPCRGDYHDQLPRAFGKLLEISPSVWAHRLIVVPDRYPYLLRPGKFAATVSKFTESGFLPGTPVVDCQTLPQTGLINVCSNFYERASGKACQQNQDSIKCEATGGAEPQASRRDDLCVLAVQGTNPEYLSNLLVDASTCLNPLSAEWGGEYCEGSQDCRAHDGFKHATGVLMPDVEQAIRDFGCKELVVTGHSHGGAIAMLLGFAIKNTHPDIQVEGAYTFDSPRLANTALAEAMEKSGYDVVRVTKQDDPVSLIPIYDIKGQRYKHVGREIFFSELNGVRSTRTCSSAACDADRKTCACSEGWRAWASLPPMSIRAHMDFSSTSLYWNETSTCPWPRLLAKNVKTEFQAISPRNANLIGEFSSYVGSLAPPPASLGYVLFTWVVAPSFVAFALAAVRSSLAVTAIGY